MLSKASGHKNTSKNLPPENFLGAERCGEGVCL
nr:MAG TPA: hypothetical protein [Caudoviricetes sp.]